MQNSQAGFLDMKTVNSWLVGLISFLVITLLSTLVFIASEALAQQKQNAKEWQSLSVQSATTKVEVGNLTAAITANTVSLKAFEHQFFNDKRRFATEQRVGSLAELFNKTTDGLDKRITVLEREDGKSTSILRADQSRSRG